MKKVEISCLLYLEPHCLPGDNARNLRVNLKWWKLSNNRWKSCLGGRGRRRKKFEKGISIVLFPPSESARSIPWNRRSIIIPRQCSIQSHGRLFHFEESISCRGLSSLRSLRDTVYWWHGYVLSRIYSNVHSKIKLD